MSRGTAMTGQGENRFFQTQKLLSIDAFAPATSHNFNLCQMNMSFPAAHLDWPAIAGNSAATLLGVIHCCFWKAEWHSEMLPRLPHPRVHGSGSAVGLADHSPLLAQPLKNNRLPSAFAHTNVASNNVVV